MHLEAQLSIAMMKEPGSNGTGLPSLVVLVKTEMGGNTSKVRCLHAIRCDLRFELRM